MVAAACRRLTRSRRDEWRQAFACGASSPAWLSCPDDRAGDRDSGSQYGLFAREEIEARDEDLTAVMHIIVADYVEKVALATLQETQLCPFIRCVAMRIEATHGGTEP